MRLDGRRTGVRTQSSLGADFSRVAGASKNIDRISLGEVIQVNYRYNTVEVSVPSNGTQTGTYAGVDGRYSARLPIQFAGTTKDGKSFGQVNPIEVGTSVLVGFIEGDKANPIVLGIYGREHENINLARTPLAGADPRNEEVKQQTQHQFTVFPSLTYRDIDGAGNITSSFTGKSFITFQADSSPLGSGLFDDGDGFNYEGLQSSYYYTGELIEPKEGRAPVILFKHQGDMINPVSGETEEDSNNFMMFLDQDGTYRLSTLDTEESWRGVFEMTPEGKIGMRHQKDTKKLNSTRDYNEVSVDHEGILFRVGDKWSKITPSGTYGNLNFGGGGGGGGGIIGGDGDFEVPDDPSGSDGLDEARRKIEEYLNLAERNILTMHTYMERTAGYITQGAQMVEDLQDELALYESNLTIMAERIMSEVASTSLPTLVNDEMAQYRAELEDLETQTKDALSTLEGLVNDNVLSNMDKEIVSSLWESIKAEQPGLLKQAQDNDVDTEMFEQRFHELDKFLEPYLEDLTSSQEINGEEFTLRFRYYYNERNKLVQSVYDSLNANLLKALRQSADAATTANTALGSSGSALVRATAVGQLMSKLAEDGVVQGVEKSQVLTQWNMIKTEYGQVKEDIRLFNTVEDGERNVTVSTVDYEESFQSLQSYLLDNLRLFEDMGEATPVSSQELVDKFTSYYIELADLQSQLAIANVNLLKQYDGDFKRLRTSITETDDSIELMAERVEAIGQNVFANSAELSVQADRIAQRVTGTTFRREIDKNRHTLNATGRNLYSTSKAVEGSVNDPSTGNVVGMPSGEISPLISVKGGYVYTVSMFNNDSPNTVVVTIFNNRGDVLIVRSVSIPDGGAETIPIPNDATHVRVSVNNAQDGNLQFEQGHGTGYFMYSNEDLVANIEYATTEARNREILWKNILTRKGSFESRNNQNLRQVTDVADDGLISSSEENMLNAMLADLETRHSTTLTDAQAGGLGTSLLEGSYESLVSYVEKLLTGNPPFDIPAVSVFTNLFETYFKRIEDIYTELEKRYKIGYESAVEVLDDVLAGNIEAERIARELAEAASNAAQSVSTLRYEKDAGLVQKEKYMPVVEDVAENGQITPVEKIELKPIKEYIDVEFEWVLTQSNAIGLSNQDLINAFNRLDSYWSSMTSGTEKEQTTTVSPLTFINNFRSFFETKDTLMTHMIEEAVKIANTTEEQATIAREETLRRDARLDEIQHILADSELAIERIEKNIEDLQETYAFTIEVMSTNGFTFKDRIINTTLEVTVYQGADDVTHEIEQEDFVWTKKDKYGNIDEEWNEAHIGVGSSVDIDHRDLQGRATITVTVYKEVN